MTYKTHSVLAGLALVISLISLNVQAENKGAMQIMKPTTGLEHAHTAQPAFRSVQSGIEKKKTKVPSSMDLFVGRCTDAGGGLISIDGHYDCVKPSGQPIPDW